MRFSVQSDLDRLSKKLTHQQKEQIPFATSLALNETADDVARAFTAQMDQYFDEPTAFTKMTYLNRNGFFRGKRSHKKKLFVDIDPGKKQMEYLKYHIDGGTRTPFRKKIFVPTENAPRNKFGNVARGLRKKMITGGGNNCHKRGDTPLSQET